MYYLVLLAWSIAGLCATVTLYIAASSSVLIAVQHVAFTISNLTLLRLLRLLHLLHLLHLLRLLQCLLLLVL
jgi:hypothetical protein